MKLYQATALFLIFTPILANAGEWDYNIEGHAQGLYG